MTQHRSENRGERRPFSSKRIDVWHRKTAVANSSGNALEDVSHVELDAVHPPRATRGRLVTGMAVTFAVEVREAGERLRSLLRTRVLPCASIERRKRKRLRIPGHLRRRNVEPWQLGRRLLGFPGRLGLWSHRWSTLSRRLVCSPGFWLEAEALTVNGSRCRT